MPKLGSPLAEVKVPKRVVDPGGLPVKDAREPSIDDKKLVLMQVTVHENVRELRSRFHLVAPLLDSLDAHETIGCLSDGLPSGGRVKGTTEPAIVGAIVVSGWSGAGYLGGCQFMPLSDCVTELIEQIGRFGWVSTGKSGNSGEGMGINSLVPPFPQKSGHNLKSYRFQRSVRG